MTTTSTPTATVLAARRAETIEGLEEDVVAVVSAIADLRVIGRQQNDLCEDGGATYQDLGPIARYIAAQMFAAFPELQHGGTFGYPHGFDHGATLATHDLGSPS